jgi:hypothetical protein
VTQSSSAEALDDAVVIQKEAYFSLFLRGYKRLYIQHEVQVDFQSTWSSYRWTGIISDVAASFLSSNCLISQHSPSGSPCWRGGTEYMHIGQASVKPLKTSKRRNSGKSAIAVTHFPL